MTTIIKCHHRRPTFICEMQKKRVWIRWGAYSAPQTPYLDLKGPTSKGGQARSYVQARGSSCLLVPRRLNVFRHK